MAAGTPLDDDDRAPWLAAIRAAIDECLATGRSAVFTCSGLKHRYRDVLMGDAPQVALVYLHGDFDTILARVSGRAGHFMKADLVRSQFDALEVPNDALTMDIRQSPESIIREIRQPLRRCEGSSGAATGRGTGFYNPASVIDGTPGSDSLAGRHAYDR